MADNYYGTIPILAWILGHYFYHCEHYVWLAEEYFPYRLPNPKSSNPHLIYQDLYQPWKDQDDFDKVILSMRLNLRKGVIAHQTAGTLTSSDATRLKDVCDKVNVVFLYPVVIRVDITTILPARRHLAGSALVGSSEILVKDLKESEFEMVFLDYVADADFKKLVVDEMTGATYTTSADALKTLEGRY
jgi:hypothetical protein